MKTSRKEKLTSLGTLKDQVPRLFEVLDLDISPEYSTERAQRQDSCAYNPHNALGITIGGIDVIQIGSSLGARPSGPGG